MHPEHRTHGADSAVDDDMPETTAAYGRNGPSAELADIIAYVEQRRDNAATIAARMAAHSEMAILAADRRRQTQVLIDDIKAGLHVGSAAVRASIEAKAAANAAAVAEIERA